MTLENNNMPNLPPRYRYPGIRPFTTEEEHLFFGRDQEIKEVVDIIDTNAITIISGSSGSGKSSLLQAGIIRFLGKKISFPYSSDSQILLILQYGR